MSRSVVVLELSLPRCPDNLSSNPLEESSKEICDDGESIVLMEIWWQKAEGKSGK
jgi:hypothetical protein